MVYILIVIFSVVMVGLTLLVYYCNNKFNNFERFILVLFSNFICFICGIVLYSQAKIEPTARDLMQGKVKVEVIETRINGELIGRDTTYTYKDEHNW